MQNEARKAKPANENVGHAVIVIGLGAAGYTQPISVLDKILGTPAARTAYFRLSRVPVVASLQRRIARRVVPLGTLRWVTVPAGRNQGMRMQVDPRSELGYLRGDHEPWLQQMLAQELKPGGCYVDVGSHVGFFGILAATLVGPTGTVHCFEPDPATFRRLCENLDANRLSGVRRHQAAAWSTAGRVTFASSSEADSGVTGHVTDTADGGEEVSAVTLDEVLGELRPGLVKIDVEGAEMEALKGAAATVRAGQTTWVVEVHSQALEQDVVRLFRDHGYETTTTSPTHETYSDYGQDYVVATPRTPA